MSPRLRDGSKMVLAALLAAVSLGMLGCSAAAPAVPAAERAGLQPQYGGTLYLAARNGVGLLDPFKENTPVWVMNIETDKLIVKAPQQIKDDIDKHLGREIVPFISFVVSCSSRRRVLDPKSSKKELQTIAKMVKQPLFGFCSFGEIGARPAETCHYNHLCTNIFNLYTELLTDL